MKKLISVLLVTLMLLSSVTVVMADDTTPVTSIELLTHQVNSRNMLLAGQLSNPDTNSAGFTTTTWKLTIPGTPAVGKVYRAVLGCQNGVTFESVLNGGNIEDYAIEITATKAAGGSVVTDFEFGFGVANMGKQAAFSSGATYKNFATVTKTVPFEAFDTAYAAKAKDQTIMTLTIPVKDILNKGVEEQFTGTSTTTYSEFEASAINEFVVKAKGVESALSYPGVMTFTSVKLVKKSADITFDEESGEFNFSVCDYSANPSVAGAQAIVAYYNDLDEDGIYNLEYCDVVPLTAQDANNASLSLPLDGTYGGMPLVKAFMFNSMDEITPLTEALVRTN